MKEIDTVSTLNLPYNVTLILSKSYIWPSDTQVYLEDSTTQETADAEESESVD